MQDIDLDHLFAAARRYESALALAIRANSARAAMPLAIRLAQALAQAKTVAETTLFITPLQRAALLAVLHNSTLSMRDLICGAPAQQPMSLAALSALLLDIGGGPDLARLDVEGVNFDDACFFGVHVASCRFFTSLRRASLIDAQLETSDFAYADLRDTMWQRTRADRSYFRSCSFADATFDSTTFVNCDLRGADFSSSSKRKHESGCALRFEHCDLRDSNWHGRDLSCVLIIDCKDQGLHGVEMPRARLVDVDSMTSPPGSVHDVVTHGCCA